MTTKWTGTALGVVRPSLFSLQDPRHKFTQPPSQPCPVDMSGMDPAHPCPARSLSQPCPVNMSGMDPAHLVCWLLGCLAAQSCTILAHVHQVVEYR